jgi:hypothetical protein
MKLIFQRYDIRKILINKYFIILVMYGLARDGPVAFVAFTFRYIKRS